MNRSSFPRALLLAGVLAACGAAQAYDDANPSPTEVVTQTWFFPDGSSHTVTLGAPATATAATADTTVLGAGPAPLPDEAAVDQPADVVTQTWFFPDGSSHTVHLSASSPAVASAL